MKRILLVFITLIIFQQADAQADTTPVYRRFPVLPVFSIMTLPDSTKLTRDDLARKKPTMIMLFSPDCDHCIHATEDLLQHIDQFKKVQIVMVSSMDYSHIRKFYQDHNIASYPNISMGRDASFYLGTFYNIRNYPSIFLYNKKGKYIRSFEGTFRMTDVAAAF